MDAVHARCTGALRPACNEDDPWACPFTTFDGGAFTAEFAYENGNGVYGQHIWHAAFHTKPTCRTELRAEFDVNDGAIVMPVRLSGPAHRNRRTVENYLRRSVSAVHFRPASLRSPEAGAARLVLSFALGVPHRGSEDALSLDGPLYATPQAGAGNPTTPQFVSVWAADVPLRPNAPLRTPRHSDPQIYFVSGAVPFPPEETSTSPFGPMVHVKSMGTLNIYEYAMPGRNRGRFVAVHDTTTNQHRWVLETRLGVLGSEIRWVGRFDDYVVGEYVSRHPGEIYRGQAGIVLVRVSDGNAFRLNVAGAFGPEGRIAYDEEQLAREDRIDACVAEHVRAAHSDWTDHDIRRAHECDREPRALAQASTDAADACHTINSELPNVVIAHDTLRVRNAADVWTNISVGELNTLFQLEAHIEPFVEADSP
ncbi:MAG: hypothetical protein IPK60_25600 [Sandaracinaceae bacterium]|nr:hypothetical protein [Sandaracinaceae bacterium]